jgi:hypothetical protein
MTSTMRKTLRSIPLQSARCGGSLASDWRQAGGRSSAVPARDFAHGTGVLTGLRRALPVEADVGRGRETKQTYPKEVGVSLLSLDLASSRS